MLPDKFRRSVALAIPIFTSLLFLGILKSFFDMEVTTNLGNTGLSVGIVFAILNGILAFMVYKHRIP